MRLEQIIKIKKELLQVKLKETKMEITPNPCWEGYEPIGLKPDGSPNCVPIKEEEQSKENFKIPPVGEGETKDEYIGRCMGVIGGEDKPQDQLIAICVSTYENK
jgi:hypothetical protein